jgi:hypothetical protein
MKQYRYVFSCVVVMEKVFKSILFLLLAVSFLATFCLDAQMNFANREASFVLKTVTNNSTFNIDPGIPRSRAASVIFFGWAQGSIVRDADAQSSFESGEYNAGTASATLVYSHSATLVMNNSTILAALSSIQSSDQFAALNQIDVRANSRLIAANSQAIKSLDANLATIDANIAPVEISSATYSQAFDIVVSGDNNFKVMSSAPNSVVIDGHGHSLRFARDQSNIFTIAALKNVLLENIVLKDFSDDVVQLGAGSSLTFGDGAVVELAAGETLSRNWTFQGTSKIVGFGNKLAMGLYDIEILQPGTLTLQDVFLNGICDKGASDKNLKCVGDGASIVLRDSSLFLSRNYTFTTGSIMFDRDVMITGTNKFTYESTVGSTISSNSTLVLDMGTTFSYGVSRRANRDLLSMTDVTSRLFINGCSLCTTRTGMRLTKGTLVVDHKNTVNSEATSLSQAMTIGNGITSDDLSIEIMPSGNINVASGILNCENSN